MLPDLPSELLTVALDDLIAVERDEHYEIDMGVWHQPRTDGTCGVCLAGSVMAKTLRTDPSWEMGPATLGLGTEVKLRALNELRVGDVERALGSLGLVGWPRLLPARVPIPAYETSADGFHARLRELVVALRRVGL